MVSRSTLSEANESVVDNGDGTYSRVIVGGTAASPSVVQGNVGSGVADSGNPVKVGGKYNATLPTFADLQRGDLQIDTRGNLRASMIANTVTGVDGTANAALAQVWDNASFFPRLLTIAPTVFNGTSWDRARGDTVGQSVIQGLTGSWWNYAAAAGGILNTTTAVTVKAAAGASVRNYIRQLELEWETLGAATEFAIRDGAAGTVLYRTKLGTVAGRKVIPLQLRGTANTLLEIVTLTASVTGAVYANLDGYTGA
jgi:hypothetical protein